MLVAPLARATEPVLLVGEAGAGSFRNQPQRSLFGPGGSVAAGAYLCFGRHLCPGLRLRGSLFADGPAPDPTHMDPALGGLGALSLALRVRPLATSAPSWGWVRGLWVESVAGAGLTGHLLRPVLEAGGGVSFDAGKLAIGPFVRYLQVMQPGSGLTGTDSRLALVGVELALSPSRPPVPPPPPPRVVAPRPPPPPPAPEPPPPPADRDGDGVIDAQDRCPDEPEVVNGVDDDDGCPDTGLIQLVADRVLLDGRVLFESGSAHVTAAGRSLLGAVVQLWKQHPEWERLEVEGHADERGAEQLNQRLSELRAQRVAEWLVRMGIPQDKLTTHGYGASRPQSQGAGQDALQRNRRVEVVVIRKSSPPAPPPPAPDTAPPPTPDAVPQPTPGKPEVP